VGAGSAAPITPEQAERLDQSLGVRRVIDDESLEQTLVADAAAQEIYPWLIAAAALALFTELLFQRRFAEPVT